MSGARTEEPTPRRLRRAREEGDGGASGFASHAVALVTAIVLLPPLVAAVAVCVEGRLRDAIQRAAAPDPNLTPPVDLADAAKDVALLSLPLLVGVAVASVAATLVQTGGFAGGARLSARLDRLNPFVRPGASTGEGLFRLARVVAGGMVVAYIAARAFRGHAADLARTAGRLGFAAPTAAAICGTVAWEAALATLAIAVIDVVVVRTARLGRLRMSRDEIKRERKETEGDPLVKEERLRAQNAAEAAGALTSLKAATIVVHDEGRAACALKYDDGDEAPVVLVSRTSTDGDGVERLVREARAHGVTVVDGAESAQLARSLSNAIAGEKIPESLYDAVAEILRGRED